MNAEQIRSFVLAHLFASAVSILLLAAMTLLVCLIGIQMEGGGDVGPMFVVMFVPIVVMGIASTCVGLAIVGMIMQLLRYLTGCRWQSVLWFVVPLEIAFILTMVSVNPTINIWALALLCLLLALVTSAYWLLLVHYERIIAMRKRTA